MKDKSENKKMSEKSLRLLFKGINAGYLISLAMLCQFDIETLYNEGLEKFQVVAAIFYATGDIAAYEK